METKARLEQEMWNDARVNAVPEFTSLSSNGQHFDTIGFRRLNDFASKYPGVAHSCAMKSDAPNLCEVFLGIYGSSSDLRFREMSHNLRKKYGLYRAAFSEARRPTPLEIDGPTHRLEEFILDRGTGANMVIYAGSSKRDYRSKVDPSWRDDQVWGNTVRNYEDGK